MLAVIIVVIIIKLLVLYAGLCLEKMPTITVSRFRQAEREQLIIRCFELSGDISLLQLQERQVA